MDTVDGQPDRFTGSSIIVGVVVLILVTFAASYRPVRDLAADVLRHHRRNLPVD